MPPLQCAKCKGCQAAEGDSWCVGCTAWESLGRELTGSWDCPGARKLANDLVISTTRQVRALRSLSAGLAREGQRELGAGSGRATSPERPPKAPEPERKPPAKERETLPRRRSSDTRREAKEERHSEESDWESEEEEEEVPRSPPRTPPKSPDHRPVRGGDPPKPPPPPERSYPGARSIGVTLSDRDRTRRRERTPPRRDRKRRGSHRSAKRRGGRKHKRLARLASNPNLILHRAPGKSFLELSVDQPGSSELGFLGR